MVKFKCTHEFDDGEKQDWIGTIDDIKNYGSHYEIKISARGTSNIVILGKYSNGWFLVIPSWDVGTSLSKYLSDINYNKEKLIMITENEIDGATIAYALNELEKKGLIKVLEKEGLIKLLEKEGLIKVIE
ncbi:DUF6618 family protein [Thermoanaerobacterium saccharolyticum]|uniref:Uncharacterized protein n=1 Tax=Thermoanaerobacterium saccharolyticum (strain DSM 8691 / JW/SL-YS485) TaxID=1094508 RepID=I3WC24_THESW|nr:DUF6618 family protein [Thermoanaerobacterium saccharolyticum]AFK94375.1 hypothetical protein Tsac_2828 [Thermoanaerobacterium saccharolyticum JW/SL-YS485]